MSGAWGEYPYHGLITRTTVSDGGDVLAENIIYDGEIDYEMPSAEIGNIAQTSDYVVYMPLIMDSNDAYVLPKKNDKIVIHALGDVFTVVVNNYVPSQMGVVTIYASRGEW